MQQKKEVSAVITSCGVAANGGVVIRVSIDGSQFQIDTNVVSFAALAAAGVPVINAKG
jgi:hypothetical protein